MRDDNRRLRDVSDVCISNVSSSGGSDLINDVDGVSIPSMSFLSPVQIIIDWVEKKCVFGFVSFVLQVGMRVGIGSEGFHFFS